MIPKGAETLKAKLIDHISQEVYRKHPDLKGVKPKITPRKGDSSSDPPQNRRRKAHESCSGTHRIQLVELPH